MRCSAGVLGCVFSAVVAFAVQRSAAVPQGCAPTVNSLPFDDAFGLIGRQGSVSNIFDSSIEGSHHLYATGAFAVRSRSGQPLNRIARWNGAEWGPMGVGFDDGSIRSICAAEINGEARIFVAGTFSSSGGRPMSRIAMWVNDEWRGLDADSLVGGTVNGIQPFSDGARAGLIVVGSNDLRTKSQVLGSVAFWDGKRWQGLGQTIAVEDVSIMEVGGKLLACIAGGSLGEIRAWDGIRWFDYPMPVMPRSIACASGNPDVRMFAVVDGGSTYRYSGGLWADSLAPLNSWVGSAAIAALANLGDQYLLFSRLSGLGDGSPTVYCWHRYHDGMWQPIDGTRTGSSNLAALGAIFTTRSAAYHACGDSCEIAVLMPSSGSTGRVLRLANDSAIDGSGRPRGPVRAIEALPALSEYSLAIGGQFDAVGSGEAHNIALWDGTEMRALGQGVDGIVNALAAPPPGASAHGIVVAAGAFQNAGGLPASRIARWDGASWSRYGAGFNGSVRALEFHASNGEMHLYAGGAFSLSGTQSVQRIARWDGASWNPVGAGTDGPVLTMLSTPGPKGQELVIGGQFTIAGSVSSPGVARWDGQAWHALGTGIGGPTPAVFAIAAHNDGTGMALYVGGSFTANTGAVGDRVARWNGTSWSSVGSGLPKSVFSLRSFDDGSGRALFAGLEDGTWRKWHNAVWTTVHSLPGFSTGSITSMAVQDHGATGSLYGAGEFGVIRYEGCSRCPADLTGDLEVNGQDLGVLLGSWGPAPGSPADINGDGSVDGIDLGFILGAWGTCAR